MKKFHRQWEKLIFWYPCCLFEFFQAPEALFQFSFHVVVHATLVLGFLLTLEEKHNSSHAWYHLEDEGQDGGWTPSECCNQREFDHLRAVFQRRSIAVAQVEFLPCLES